MELPFLDTNIFIRHLAQPEPGDPNYPRSLRQSRQAYELFKRVEAGHETVFAIEGVIVEVVQVLSSKRLYNLPREEISAKLGGLLALPNLRLPLKAVVLNALTIYAGANLDFVDALLVARMQREKQPILISFDRDFDRVPGIARQEP